MKARGEKIASLTAYDAGFAALIDEAGTDLVLVGDSLGMVVQGHKTTVPVTVDDIVYHSAMVARGLSRAFLIADLPFMSYATPEQALASAARLMQQGGAQMVKLEGKRDQANIVERLARCDIPVCAHIGLRPQSVHKMGGYRVHGKGDEAADALLEDARLLENAGADMILIECVSSPAAARITQEVSVPVIGIGAGPDVDGQILVLYDVLGVTRGPMPRFSKDFTGETASPFEAVRRYVEAVKDGSYPAPEHCFA
jgi:3-methyl-2-oxobutanoate hydroxymethyltransferase